MRVSPLGSLPGSLLSEDAGKIKTKQKNIYLYPKQQHTDLGKNTWALPVSICGDAAQSFWWSNPNPTIQGSSKPNQPNPSTHTGRVMPLWKMSNCPSNLPLALVFCTPSPSMMSFSIAFSYKGALGDVGLSNPEPTFQNTLHFEKPLFVSQRNKGVCIIKPLSPHKLKVSHTVKNQIQLYFPAWVRLHAHSFWGR